MALHIRPPSNHTPINQLSFDKDAVLRGAVNDLLKALKRPGKPKKGKGLDELSIKYLPIQVRFGVNEDEEPTTFDKALTKLHLKTPKIGLVSSTVWNRDAD